MRPVENVSWPSNTPRDASSSSMGGWPADSSATTSRTAEAPMSITATVRGLMASLEGFEDR
jgi:hypothetical protein